MWNQMHRDTQLASSRARTQTQAVRLSVCLADHTKLPQSSLPMRRCCANSRKLFSQTLLPPDIPSSTPQTAFSDQTPESTRLTLRCRSQDYLTQPWDSSPPTNPSEALASPSMLSPKYTSCLWPRNPSRSWWCQAEGCRGGREVRKRTRGGWRLTCAGQHRPRSWGPERGSHGQLPAQGSRPDS